MKYEFEKLGLIVRYKDELLFKIENKGYALPLFSVLENEDWITAIKRIAKENYNINVDDSISNFFQDNNNKIQYFIWKIDKKFKLDNFKWISFGDIYSNKINLILAKEFKSHLISFCRLRLILDNLFNISDKELFDDEKEFITGTISGLGGNIKPEIPKIIENIRRHMEMIRRFKNSVEKSNKIMTFLTIILAILALIQIYLLLK